MAKSVAQFIEEETGQGDGTEPGTIMLVDGHPYIYLPPGKRPYFKEKDGAIVLM